MFGIEERAETVAIFVLSGNILPTENTESEDFQGKLVSRRAPTVSSKSSPMLGIIIFTLLRVKSVLFVSVKVSLAVLSGFSAAVSPVTRIVSGDMDNVASNGIL